MGESVDYLGNYGEHEPHNYWANSSSWSSLIVGHKTDTNEYVIAISQDENGVCGDSIAYLGDLGKHEPYNYYAKISSLSSRREGNETGRIEYVTAIIKEENGVCVWVKASTTGVGDYGNHEPSNFSVDLSSHSSRKKMATKLIGKSTVRQRYGQIQKTAWDTADNINHSITGPIYPSVAHLRCFFQLVRGKSWWQSDYLLLCEVLWKGDY